MGGLKSSTKVGNEITRIHIRREDIFSKESLEKKKKIAATQTLHNHAVHILSVKPVGRYGLPFRLIVGRKVRVCFFFSGGKKAAVSELERLF